MRRVLIDPLSEPVQIALCDGGAIIRQAEASAKDRAVALDEAFQALGEISGVQEVVVVNGPGNFTAIRAGIGYARGLGMAFGVQTRGISILDVDQEFANGARIVRDARGSRAYLAKVGDIYLIANAEIPKDAASFDDIDGVNQLSATANERMIALAKLASNGVGAIPACANYIRPADAAPSNIVPPKIIANKADDR